MRRLASLNDSDWLHVRSLRWDADEQITMTLDWTVLLDSANSFSLEVSTPQPGEQRRTELAPGGALDPVDPPK